MKAKPKDVPASIRARLLNVARECKEEYQYVITRFANERLLYRLSCSTHRDRFILKGASLFILWNGSPHRATRDIDLMSFGAPSAVELLNAFRDICRIELEDGLLFRVDSMAVTTIREDEEYQGLRLKMVALLGTAEIPIQIDVGYGDAVTPTAEETDLPTLLDLPAARLRTYPRETVIAEKLHVIAVRGIANSRLKDYYDLWHLSGSFSYDGTLLSRAIRATFDRRETAIPTDVPVGLTPEFTADSNRERAWNGFLARNRLYVSQAPSLSQIGEELTSFIVPVLMALASKSRFEGTWDFNSRQWETP